METGRKFNLNGKDFISCDTPCSELHARIVESQKKMKGLPTLVSKRCVAPGAAQRGQHYAMPSGHENNLAACRVCTIFTAIDKSENSG